jgi:hypothetical protein
MFASSPAAFDAQYARFFPANNTKISELLAALPMVRADGVQRNEAGEISFTRRQLPGAPTTASYYNETTAPGSLGTAQAADTRIVMGRLGLPFSAARIDVHAAAAHTAADPLYWRAMSATVSVLQQLDTTIATGTAASRDFIGLGNLVQRSVAYTGMASLAEAVATALVRVFPNSSATAEGPDCLIGNADLMLALMKTTAGQTGASGWYHDVRTGRPVYHFMGVPFYRTASLTDTNTTTLYAANLGSAGLHLVYAYGSSETYGLEINANDTDATTGLNDYIVTGAFALVLWEPEAAYAITSVPV